MASEPSTVLFEIAKVFIPPNRQRKELGDLESLADAISATGLINPIVVKGTGELVAGERRFRAVRDHIKASHIRATIFETLSPVQAAQIELQENIARKQLTWQEEALAIADYHAMKSAWIADKSYNLAAGLGIPWTAKGTASDLGFSSEKHVTAVLRVAAEIRAGDQEVKEATTLRGAINLLTSRAERTRAAAAVRGIALAGPASLPSIIKAGASKEENTAAVIAAMLNPAPAVAEPLAQTEAPEIPDTTELEAQLAAHMEEERADPTIITGDFLEWADQYAGPKFDVLHIDFPYGKGYAGSNTRKTGRATFAPRYNDSPEIYWQLLAGFLDLQDNIVFEVAHCIFWFDLPYYTQTIELFGEAGWKLVAPYPLVWTKSYEGVASDPRRRPRHCYETALLFSRGDRKLVNLDKDHFECSGRSGPDKLHLNQKPYSMLRHFLNLIVDANTAVLDPTCGSAMALRAAQELGSPRVLGIELDKSSAEMARFNMIRPLEDLTNAA